MTIPLDVFHLLATEPVRYAIIVLQSIAVVSLVWKYYKHRKSFRLASVHIGALALVAGLWLSFDIIIAIFAPPIVTQIAMSRIARVVTALVKINIAVGIKHSG